MVGIRDAETKRRLIEIAIRETIIAYGDDPDEPVSDAGHTVFDAIKAKIKSRNIRPTPQEKGL